MIRWWMVNYKQTVLAALLVCQSMLFMMSSTTAAISPLPIPAPQPGSFGLAATKTQPAPTIGATITTPGNGASFSNSPITVSGICPNGLLVQLYNNGVMVGSVMCNNGSFSLQLSLFAGTNELTAIVYDDLDQPGPTSPAVTVSYNDSRLVAFGQLITLTSSFGRRAAPTGSELVWPLQLSGGTGPYAFSIDWGDGSSPELKSQASTGNLQIAHTYKKAGIYQVNIRVTDANGVSAFLQVIAVASGKVEAAGSSGQSKGDGAAVVKILWVPMVILFLLLLPSYWLGRRSQLVSIHNKMLKEREAYQQK